MENNQSAKVFTVSPRKASIQSSPLQASPNTGFRSREVSVDISSQKNSSDFSRKSFISMGPSKALSTVGDSEPSRSSENGASTLTSVYKNSGALSYPDSVIDGLLKKYFDPKFKTQLDNMDKTARANIIMHLLTVFQKIDQLLSVSRFISLDISLDETISLIADATGEMLQCEYIIIYLIDPETEELVSIDIDSLADNKDRELFGQSQDRFPKGAGIAGRVAMTERHLNVKDITESELFDPEIDARVGSEILEAHSILCVPVKNRDGIMKGVLSAVNKINSRGMIQSFIEEDEYLLNMLGRQAGIIIHNGQIYGQMKRTQKKVEVLLETTRSLGSTLQLDILVKMIMEAAKELLDADRCTIFLVDPTGKYLITHVQGRDFIQEIRIPVSKGIAGLAFSTGS